MKAELILMGKRLNMAPRMHRRRLVVLTYVTLAVLMAALYAVDHWRTTGYYLVIATGLINRFFLGGYNFGGLIKPFNEKTPHRTQLAPPYWLLALHVYRPDPLPSEFRSDERELEQRGHAHYRAYQALAFMLSILWILASFNAFMPRLLSWSPLAPAQLIYAVVLAIIVLMLTLPQALLLWTEPDMEDEL